MSLQISFFTAGSAGGWQRKSMGFWRPMLCEDCYACAVSCREHVTRSDTRCSALPVDVADEILEVALCRASLWGYSDIVKYLAGEKEARVDIVGVDGPG